LKKRSKKLLSFGLQCRAAALIGSSVLPAMRCFLDYIGINPIRQRLASRARIVAVTVATARQTEVSAGLIANQANPLR
jgi:hypothetical protein